MQISFNAPSVLRTRFRTNWVRQPAKLVRWVNFHELAHRGAKPSKHARQDISLRMVFAPLVQLAATMMSRRSQCLNAQHVQTTPCRPLVQHKLVTAGLVLPALLRALGTPCSHGKWLVRRDNFRAMPFAPSALRDVTTIRLLRTALSCGAWSVL